MKINLKVFSVILILSAVIYSCEYDHPVPITIEDEPVSFSTQIQPIFDAGCNGSGCHSTGAIPPDLTTANSYSSLLLNDMIETVNPASSELYTSLSSGSMKSYVSSPTDAALILKWIEQGAKNN